MAKAERSEITYTLTINETEAQLLLKLVGAQPWDGDDSPVGQIYYALRGVGIEVPEDEEG